MFGRLCGEQSIAIRNGGVELRSPKTLLLQAHQSAWAPRCAVASCAALMNMEPAANADANRRPVVVARRIAVISRRRVAVAIARRRNDAAAQAADQGESNEEACHRLVSPIEIDSSSLVLGLLRQVSCALTRVTWCDR